MAIIIEAGQKAICEIELAKSIVEQEKLLHRGNSIFFWTIWLDNKNIKPQDAVKLRDVNASKIIVKEEDIKGINFLDYDISMIITTSLTEKQLSDVISSHNYSSCINKAKDPEVIFSERPELLRIIKAVFEQRNNLLMTWNEFREYIKVQP